MMANDSYNIINPVESLQNVAGLTPVQQNKERKRRQDLQKDQHKDTEDELDEPTEEIEATHTGKYDDDPHSIDYCA